MEEIERYHVELFRETLSEVPTGAIIDSEEPDVLIESSGTIIGVEITELYHEASQSARFGYL
jgi:hypothetical protein